MNINGKQLADDIKTILKKRVAILGRKPRLDIVYAGKNSVIEGFLRMKRRMGEDIGVETNVLHLPATVSQKSLIDEIQKITADKNSDGIIVQLPLPESFDTEMVLRAISTEKDVDVLSENALLLFEQGKHFLLPPVTGAIALILQQHNINIAGKNTVVLGNGRLVGKPVAAWLKQNGALVTVLDKPGSDPTPLLQKADIIVSGTGNPYMIKPEMIRQGVILFDAGASEEAGEIRGDADPACSDKCALFTPVPGGIGHITVVMLFKNLLDVMEKNIAVPSARIELTSTR